MDPDKTLIRKRAKFTGSAKITLAAASILSFVGGWNLIAHIEQKDAQASEPPTPVPSPTLPPATPTPWPTIPSLADLPAIPTLVPTLTTAGFPIIETTNPNGGNIEAVQAAPLPTMAPLPTLAPLPVLQAPVPLPPPPPMPVPNGDQHQSGGS